MKTLMKLLGSALMGAAFMGGCVTAGVVIPKRGPSPDVALLQAQMVEVQATLESFTPYDQFAANPIDEMAGLK